MNATTPFAGRLIEEGEGLCADAEQHGVQVRLMGGVGIRLLLGERFPSRYERPYRDLDIIIRRKQRRDVEALLSARGWEPAGAFNALGGGRRLLFEDPASDAQIDVFVESFEMCHTLPFAESLGHPGPTLPATDLLMSKLQIIELNPKDRGDCYALLEGCEIADGNHRAIEPARIAGLAGEDWGLHHTFELNLARLQRALASAADADVERISGAIAELSEVIEHAPKSRAWKLRARIGERKRWYEEPEEVDRQG